MRILFINTFDKYGGAAIVASRLRKGLAKIYNDETCAVVAKKWDDEENVIRSRTKFQGIAEKVLNRVQNFTGYQYQYFPFSTRTILSAARALKPDVISLHNTHGGYFATPMLPRLSEIAPIVWTLHDMWSFTGNSAHTFGDENWKLLKNPDHLTKVDPTIRVNRGEYLLHQKKDIYARTNLTLVTPSKWLHDLAVQSPVFENKRIVHINNGVDLDIYKPHDNKKIRTKLNIPMDSVVLMFSADFIKNNPWKGGAELFEALKSVGSSISTPVHVIVSGRGELGELAEGRNFIVHRTGFISGQLEMAEYLSAADLLLYPTRADNLPNVLVEAIACGLPCVTTDIGGCSEIIVNDYNGYVVQPKHSDQMASAIVRLLNDRAKLKEMSLKARVHAQEHFSIEEMCEKYRNEFSRTKDF